MGEGCEVGVVVVLDKAIKSLRNGLEELREQHRQMLCKACNRTKAGA